MTASRSAPAGDARGSLLLVLLAACVLAAGFALIGWRDLIGDEWAHLKQANDLQATLRDGTPFVPVHPALPGYHLLLAAAGLSAGSSALAFYRGVTAALALPLVLLGFRIARMLGSARTEAALKALQALFFPLMFPFLFLLYTDVLSVVLVLLALHEVLARRTATAGLAMLAAILVRQNNVLWMLFLVPLILYQEWRGVRLRALLHYAGKTWVFLLGAFLLALFALWNGGVALADEGAHPPFSLHVGNTVVALLEFLLLFLPLCVVLYPRVLQIVTVRPRRALLLFLALFVLTMVAFYNTHGYNFDPWWLRNTLLLFFTANPAMKAAVVPLIALALLFLRSTPLASPRFLLLYPVGFLYFGMSWLVEPRYHFIPFVLLILLRRSSGRRIEIALLLWFIVLSVVLFEGAWHGRYLP